MKKPFTRESDRLVAAMPNASVPTRTAVIIGVFRWQRIANRRSVRS
jgi:hypothetical protein